MKILKIILLVIVIAVAIPLITALFVNGEYHVERQMMINEPRMEVFKYIKFLKNQDNFSVWAKMDPAMKKEFRGIDGMVGFVSAWESDSSDVGKGEQEIMKISDGNRVDFEIRFIKPFESTSPAYFMTESVNDSVTQVTWAFDGKMPYPMNLMRLFMNMDEMIGNDLQAGLENLKEILEK